MFDCYDTVQAVLQVTTGVMSTLKVRKTKLTENSAVLLLRAYIGVLEGPELTEYIFVEYFKS